MKKLDHFKQVLESNKETNLKDLEQLTITKEGKTEVYTSPSSKTVEEAEAEEGDGEETTKTKKDSNKDKKPEVDTKDDKEKDTKTEKEDN
tara:strand:+ start:88 stop:357 length:270 start_codon:yes stop_codon:yes gene_type:complete